MLDIPNQAIILAGLGSPLRRLTETRPNPLIEMHGTPITAYVERVLACLIGDGEPRIKGDLRFEIDGTADLRVAERFFRSQTTPRRSRTFGKGGQRQPMTT
ncbi:hypothetical protein [Bradyrhizobium valentinum]|uniref:Uncharacterized protein n=1 Tax=Bradyrhizobium valentinum TaxID=1518501 RepID=A0A0R3LVY2_9BRAD|nr:hypothetical protein [Bradyrhizobium valentinum]KRR11406.1 hypothetical protein CP49_34480 [Bradyrhizobium valentinum]